MPDSIAAIRSPGTGGVLASPTLVNVPELATGGLHQTPGFRLKKGTLAVTAQLVLKRRNLLFERVGNTVSIRHRGEDSGNRCGTNPERYFGHQLGKGGLVAVGRQDRGDGSAPGAERTGADRPSNQRAHWKHGQVKSVNWFLMAAESGWIKTWGEHRQKLKRTQVLLRGMGVVQQNKNRKPA